MGAAKVANTLNKTLHLTGIGLAVQAFYINLTLDSALGGEYLELRPVGPPIINPANVWGINNAPMLAGYDRRGLGKDVQRSGSYQSLGGNSYDTNGYRDQNGFYHDNSGLKNGYDVGKTYGGGRDAGVTSVDGKAFGDLNGRNKGHQVAGFSTSYQKNESGNKATYYDDGLGHGGVVQYGLRDQRFRDGNGNAYGGGYHDSSLKTNNLGNQGQYGNLGGYRGTDNKWATAGAADLYKSGIGQGGVAQHAYVPAPIVASAPFIVQKPIAGGPIYGPAHYGHPPIASGPIYGPAHYGPAHYGPPHLGPAPIAGGSIYGPPDLSPALPLTTKLSGPYVIPTPTKLYYDKPY